MDDTVKGLDFDFPYLDDVLVVSSPVEEHLSHLRQVFEIYREKGLFINIEKCQLGQSEVEFLVYMITANAIKPIYRKVEAIINRKRPV